MDNLGSLVSRYSHIGNKQVINAWKYLHVAPLIKKQNIWLV